MVSIKELTPVVETLNEKRNEVNQIIADLNAKLAKLNVGIEVVLQRDIYIGNWVLSPPHNDRVAQTRKYVQLGYTKQVHDQWELATYEQLESKHCDADEDNWVNDEVEASEGTWTSLLEAPLSLRIKALSEVENLVTLMQSQALEEIKVIDQARALANKL